MEMEYRQTQTLPSTELCHQMEMNFILWSCCNILKKKCLILQQMLHAKVVNRIYTALTMDFITWNHLAHGRPSLLLEQKFRTNSSLSN